MPNFTLPDDCGCKNYNPCVQLNSVTLDTGCPINLDTACVFYHLDGSSASNLTNLNLPNGSDLATILDAIDDKLQSIDPVFPSYTATCINYNGFVINTIEEFQQAIDDEFCSVKSNITTFEQNVNDRVDTLETLINTINAPYFEDACGIGILKTDSIKDILIKLKDAYCLLIANTFSDNSPIFSGINSPSIEWISGGTKGHTPLVNVKKSSSPGNNLQILSDGLYVGDILPTTQVLSFNSTTRVITLSQGGGTVTLPPDSDHQQLSLNTLTNVLSIQRGNSVDLTPILPVFNQVALNPSVTESITISATGTSNTDISADVNISADAGNILVINSDGLFVPETDPTTITDTICFRFKIVNTDVSSKSYDYKDCSGTVFNSVSISGNTSVTLTAKGVFSSDPEVEIFNLGFNF